MVFDTVDTKKAKDFAANRPVTLDALAAKPTLAKRLWYEKVSSYCSAIRRSCACFTGHAAIEPVLDGDETIHASFQPPKTSKVSVIVSTTSECVLGNRQPNETLTAWPRQRLKPCRVDNPPLGGWRAFFAIPCPLMAQSRHRFRCWTCPLSGAKRTSLIGWPMSANDPKRTYGGIFYSCAVC